RLPLMSATPVSRNDEDALHPGAEAKDSVTLEHAPDLRGVKVLVIDDEEDSRNLLRAMIEHYGAEVRLAGSATEGFEAAKQWKPSIVVSDIGMPLEDGYAFIEKLRAWEKESGAWIPAVALTAYGRTA